MREAHPAFFGIILAFRHDLIAFAAAVAVGVGEVGGATKADLSFDGAGMARIVALAFLAGIGFHTAAAFVGEVLRFDSFDVERTDLAKSILRTARRFRRLAGLWGLALVGTSGWHGHSHLPSWIDG